jgi:formylglycine-generating enzyme required for sulfatase activity
MTNQRPRPDDAVLGGQNQAPLDAAVLGGIQGIRQKLASDNEDAKRKGILQALNYGEKGIEALFGVLEQETNLGIQGLAYLTLEKQGNPIIEVRLKTYFPWYEYESVKVNRRGEIIQRTPERAKYYREDLGNGVYLDMVYINEGDFLMGAPETEHQSDHSERPQHLVHVPSFWIGKYQVTQAQWQTVMGNNPARFQGANRPVERISSDMCRDFCRKLLERTGKRYRLPSEAEWEYACRAGRTTPFSCGETITTELANYHGDYTYAEEEKSQYRKETVEAGSFPPNPWGLYEMHGNVWEWCEDRWHGNYEGAPIDGSAWINNYSQNRFLVLRGGAWHYYPAYCRSAYRLNNSRVVGNGSSLRLVFSSSIT